MIKSLASLGIRSMNSFSHPLQNKFNNVSSLHIIPFSISNKFQTRNYLHWVEDIEDESDIHDTIEFLGM